MPGVGGFYCEGLHHPITTTLLLLIVTGGVVFAGSQPEANGSHSPRGRRSNCANRGVTTSDPKVKVVFKPIPKPVGKGSADHLSANEISGKGSDSGPGEHAYFPGSVGDIGTEAPCHDPGPDISVTTSDDSDGWKTRVIIACTVAAAIEIIIIIVIIAYWREIRWTMRKIACPCTQMRQYEGHNTPIGYHIDQGPSGHGQYDDQGEYSDLSTASEDERPSRHGDHEAMERAEGSQVRRSGPPERRDLIRSTEDEIEELEADGPAQTFRHPRRSRTQEALDDVTDETTPV